MGPQEEETAALAVGCREMTPADGLAERLAAARAAGRPLIVKLGCDPTAADLHLGHCVALSKLAQFQALGHAAVFLVGDTTAAIGDPTGRNKLRPPLSSEAIARHAETYTRQAMRILDPARTRVVFNSSWLAPLNCQQMVGLMARYNLGRMLERRDFKDRLAGGHQIAMHELVYPLLQAYDSVVLGADVELGGEDQIFNLLVGRHLMASFGRPPQVAMTVPLLVGTCGVDKMSKSAGNSIGIDEPKEAMFAKIMGVSDATMVSWYPLLTHATAPEGHPMEAKKALAEAMVARFWGAPAGHAARAWWEAGRPPAAAAPLALAGPVALQRLVVAVGGAASGQEARRKILQGGVSLDGARVVDPVMQVEVGAHRLRVGRQLTVDVVLASGAAANQ